MRKRISGGLSQTRTLGDHKAVDDVTGSHGLASRLSQDWQGRWTESYDAKHPALEPFVTQPDRERPEYIRSSTNFPETSFLLWDDGGVDQGAILVEDDCFLLWE